MIYPYYTYMFQYMFYLWNSNGYVFNSNIELCLFIEMSGLCTVRVDSSDWLLVLLWVVLVLPVSL